MMEKKPSSFMQKLPNYLTFMRILVIPGVVASFSFPGIEGDKHITTNINAQVMVFLMLCVLRTGS